MSLSITDSDRRALIVLLHELAEHRRRAREPFALPDRPLSETRSFEIARQGRTSGGW